MAINHKVHSFCFSPLEEAAAAAAVEREYKYKLVIKDIIMGMEDPYLGTKETLCVFSVLRG